MLQILRKFNQFRYDEIETVAMNGDFKFFEYSWYSSLLVKIF